MTTNTKGGDTSMPVLIIWLFLLLIIFLLPVPEIRIRPELPLDKIVHFLIYGITAILFYRVLRLKLKGQIFLSIALSVLYGLLLEVLQHFTSYRSFSLFDIMANTFGATIFVLLYTGKLMLYNQDKA